MAGLNIDQPNNVPYHGRSKLTFRVSGTDSVWRSGPDLSDRVKRNIV